MRDFTSNTQHKEYYKSITKEQNLETKYIKTCQVNFFLIMSAFCEDECNIIIVWACEIKTRKHHLTNIIILIWLVRFFCKSFIYNSSNQKHVFWYDRVFR